MFIEEIKKELISKYHKRTATNYPFVIGIDGLSGAGKTTLVNQLESELKEMFQIVVIHMDDHIVERNRRYNTGYAEWYEYYYLQWEIKELTEKLFKSIRKDHKITLPYYEKAIDKNINKTISIPPDSIILIEGIFLQRKEWSTLFDYVIYIECPREIRYERVLKRDQYIGNRQEIIDKYKRRYWLGEKHYLEMEDPIRTANKVYKS